MVIKDQRFPTWRWIAITAISLVGTLSYLGYADVKEQIAAKADKQMVEHMYGEIMSIKEILNSHVIATGAGQPSPRRGK